MVGYCVNSGGLDYVFMRSVRLFLYFVLGLGIAVNAVLAFAADTCPPSKYVWFANGVTGGSAAELCSNIATQSGNPNIYFNGTNSCVSGPMQNFVASVVQSPRCYDDSVPVGGVCPCPNPCSNKAGKYYNNGNGMESTANLVGGDGAFSGDTTASHMPDTMCLDNCMATTANLDGGAVGNQWYGYGNPQFTGQKCSTVASSSAVPKPPPSPEYDCVKAGKGFGYVNGNVMCVAINKTQENQANTTSTTKPDGSKTDVKTDSSVKCDGTNCVTTTIITTTEFNSSGTQTGQTQTTQSTSKPDPSGAGASGTGTKGDSSFCAQNPTSPMCQSGGFSGTCGAVPDCTGDAVQCATAKATFETKCALVASQNAVDSGVLALGGGDQETHDATKRQEVNVTISDSNSGGGGAGNCPSDKSISVLGQTVVIPYSDLCGGMAVMRIALIAMASFTAAFIVLGGVK